MNWKSCTLEIVAILALCAAVLFGGYRWGAAVTQRDAALAPRDTLVKWKIDTVKVPEIRVKTITVTHVDTVGAPPSEAWYKAEADTTLNGIHYEIAYLSPVPLSPLGFFTDLNIELPPRIDSIRTEYITRTVTVVEKEIAWEWIVAGTAIGAAATAILIKAN